MRKTATPPKINIAPEKWWLVDYFPIGKVTFQGQAVKLREGMSFVSELIFELEICGEIPLIQSGSRYLGMWRNFNPSRQYSKYVEKWDHLFPHHFTGAIKKTDPNTARYICIKFDPAKVWSHLIIPVLGG